jgi:hypothetical protein
VFTRLALPPTAPHLTLSHNGKLLHEVPFSIDLLDRIALLVGRDLQNTDAHRELLHRLGSDLIAGRRTLPEAADLLADFSRQRTGEWLRAVGRRYPGRSEEASVAAALVYFTLFGLHDGDPEEEATARRLAAEYRTCYGAPLTLPEPAKGAAIPPSRRAAGLDRAEGP